MKNIFSATWIRRAAAAFAMVAVTAASLAVAPGVVHAEDNGVTPTPAAAQANAQAANKGRALERAFKREEAGLKKQGERIERASAAADKLSDLIQKAKSKGKDVTGLETALSTFRQQLTRVRAAHEQAADILKAHEGFDANGKVTDAAAARQTVEKAAKTMEDARVLLKQATSDLHSSVRAWRKAHPAVKKTPQP